MNGLALRRPSARDLLQHFVPRRCQTDICKRNRLSDTGRELENLFHEGSRRRFHHQLDQDAECHFFPVKKTMRLRSSRQAIVNRVCRGQSGGFEAEPGKQRIRLHQAIER